MVILTKQLGAGVYVKRGPCVWGPGFLQGVEDRGEQLRSTLRAALLGNPRVKEVGHVHGSTGARAHGSTGALDLTRPAHRLPFTIQPPPPFQQRAVNVTEPLMSKF